MPETRQETLDEMLGKLTAEASAYRAIRDEFKQLKRTEPEGVKRAYQLWQKCDSIISLTEETNADHP